MTGLNIRDTPAKCEGYSCMACFRSALGASAAILVKAKPTDENLQFIKPKCCFKDAGMTLCVLCAEYGMNCALAPTMLEGDWLCLIEILEWVYGVLGTNLSQATRHALVLAAHRLCVAFDAAVMAHCKEFGLPLAPFGNWNRKAFIEYESAVTARRGVKAQLFPVYSRDSPVQNWSRWSRAQLLYLTSGDAGWTA
ncbi:hypothetical protein FGRMN_7109 [Fusarium graminum]|nr:hypothetical protein FGRMN_7109 [Fusarium graminum]